MGSAPGSLLVMGAGSVGCWVGGWLAAAGVPVDFVGRARVVDALRLRGLTLTDLRRHQMALKKSEPVGFSETYTDLIAYVLRWVESMGVSDGQAKAHRKAVKETLQASDYLSRAITKRASESVMLSDALRQLGIKRMAESVAMAEQSQKLIAKNRAESFGL
ncbi:MAG: hypothetical protein JNL98_44185, partial [Bryobacterales bacterium]|nr:hypothetical protein [Bryobacterales bacterium]